MYRSHVACYLRIPHTRGGEPAVARVQATLGRSIPHTRGGEPEVRDNFQSGLKYSPHTWG